MSRSSYRKIIADYQRQYRPSQSGVWTLDDVLAFSERRRVVCQARHRMSGLKPFSRGLDVAEDFQRPIGSRGDCIKQKPVSLLLVGSYDDGHGTHCSCSTKLAHTLRKRCDVLYSECQRRLC